jgi:FKBP-type peptidyl-prolyl cis-trans isomerase
MRRTAIKLSVPLLAVAVVAAPVLAGCGSSPSGSHSSSGASSSVSVSGGFGQAPTVKIPAQKAGSSLTVKTLVHGSGPVLQKTDAFVGNYAIYVWSGTSHKLLQSSFTSKQPTLFAGQLLPGLETALIGKNIGSRVLAVIPPKQGFGTSGNSQAGIKGTDTLVFVVDMIKSFTAKADVSGKQTTSGGHGLPTVTAKPGTAPTVTIPSAKPPSSLVTKVLVPGTGPTVTKGQTLVVQYVGVNYRTKKAFDASWTHGQPFGFSIGATPSQVIPGWDKGLLGQKVGSRVLLVVPPKDGYGKSGNSQAGIKGTDTLVFVVDILGAFGGSQSS